MAPRKDKSTTAPEVIKVEVPEGSTDALALIDAKLDILRDSVQRLDLRVDNLSSEVDSSLSDIEDLQSAIASQGDEIEGLQRKARNPSLPGPKPSHGPMVPIAVGIASLFTAITGGQR
jgi:hypothetical protein